MPPLNLVHLIYDLGLGGAERQLYELATRLPSERYHQTIVRFKPAGEYAARFVEHGINVLTVHKRQAIDLSFFTRLTRVLRELKPDIVHSWMRTANLWGRAAALRLKPRPAIVAGVRNTHPGLPSWRRALIAYLGRRSTRVIGNSRAVAAQMLKFGVPAERLAVIENGIDFSRFDREIDRPAVLKAEGLDPELPMMLTIGRLIEQKDHATLIAAVKTLVEQGARAQFAIIGDGPLTEQTRELIEKARLAGRVHILKPRPQVEELVLACDVFVLPSLHEGFPNVLAEAMGCAKPCIATAVSGSVDMIEDGKRGFLIDVGDAKALADRIARYLGDASLAAAHGAAAKAYIRENNSVEAMVDRYDALYTHISP